MEYDIDTVECARKCISYAYRNHYHIFKHAVEQFMSFMLRSIDSEWDYSLYESSEYGNYSKDLMKFMNGSGFPLVYESEYIVIANIIQLNIRNYLHKTNQKRQELQYINNGE